jgi:hypothetical protein
MGVEQRMKRAGILGAEERESVDKNVVSKILELRYRESN